MAEKEDVPRILEGKRNLTEVDRMGTMGKMSKL